MNFRLLKLKDFGGFFLISFWIVFLDGFERSQKNHVATSLYRHTNKNSQQPELAKHFIQRIHSHAQSGNSPVSKTTNATTPTFGKALRAAFVLEWPALVWGCATVTSLGKIHAPCFRILQIEPQKGSQSWKKTYLLYFVVVKQSSFLQGFINKTDVLLNSVSFQKVDLMHWLANCMNNHISL